MNQRIVISLAGLLLVCVLFTACDTSTKGPTIWLDSPLDGVNLPLAAVTILAHASDKDGVSKIEFYVDTNKLASIPAGGNHLGMVSFEWKPPSAGKYLISARAVDNQGKFGDMTSAYIVIGTIITQLTPVKTVKLADQALITKVECGPGQKVGIEFQITSSTGVISAEVFSTWVATSESKQTYSSPYPLKVSEKLWLEEPFPDDIDRYHMVAVKAILFGVKDPLFGYAYEPGSEKRCPGHYKAQLTSTPTLTLTPEFLLVWIALQDSNCRSGPGTAYEAINSIMTGEQVPIEGKNADSSWFVVRKPGESNTCWVSIGTGKVEGDLNTLPVVSAPPLVTKTVTVTAIPVLPVDTIAPTISNLSLTPDSILVEGSGCSSSPRTTIVSATVTDNGTVSRVFANVQGIGDVEMYSVGGNVYQATLGPYMQGTYLVTVGASDVAGYSSQQGPLTLTVAYCIE